MRYRMRIKLSGKKTKRLRLILVIIVIAGTFIWLDSRLRPVITTMAQYQCKVVSLLAMNEAITQELAQTQEDAEDIVLVKRNASGLVTSVEVNALEMNRLKTRLTQAVANRLLGIEHQEIGIPLGTLIGWQLLAGRGPEIKLQVVPTSFVSTTTRESLETAGINQTQYAVFVDFAVEMSAILPGYTTSVIVENTVCVSQTMIVGQVPEFYAVSE